MQSKNHFQLFKKPLLFLMAVILLWGVLSYTQMYTSLFPEMTFPKITLIADNGQQPVDRMMVTVTKPIESALKRVKGVKVVRSSTSRGSCVVSAYFDWDVDIYNTKTLVESRINEIKNFLPANTTIQVEAMNQSIFPVYGLTLESKTANLVELRKAGMYIVRPGYSQVNGISNVVVRGGKTKQYVVTPDVAKMTALKITPDDISNAVADNNFVETNGQIADFRRLYLTLTDTRVQQFDDLGEIIVKYQNSRIIKLKDIAQISLDEELEFTKINANGHEAIIVDLVKQEGVNLIDFAKNVAAKTPEIQAQLPEGMVIKPYYNQAAFVSDSIHSVIKSILEGLLLAMFVTFISLKSFKAGIKLVLIIPVIFALTVSMIHLFGLTLNVMSLGAIAASIGLVIDDAIVIIEQIYRGHEEAPEKNKFTVVKEAIQFLFPAMVGSSLSTIVIFIPFGLMTGVAGGFFKELSLTMVITLTCSFVVTWLGIPALHLMLGEKKEKESAKELIKEEKEKEGKERKKLQWLFWFFNKPWYAVGFCAFLLVSSAWLTGKVETGFLPKLDEGTIVCDYYSPSGTSLEETDALLQKMEKIIMEHPDVESYSRRLGLRMAFRTLPANYGDYLIQLKTSRKQSTEEVIDQLRKKIEANVPVLTIGFGQRIADLLGDLMNTAAPIEVKIFGDNQQRLEQLAFQVGQSMAKVEGVEDIQNGLVNAGPSIVFVPNQKKLLENNLSLKDFQQQLSTIVGGVSLGVNSVKVNVSPQQSSLGGLQVGEIQEGEQMLKILMRYNGFLDNNLDDVMKRPVFMKDGTIKPLNLFCTYTIIPGEIELKREDLKSDIVLEARLNGKELGTAIDEIQRQIKADVQLPQGYNIAYGGQYSEQQQSFKELMLILVTAVLLVFMILIFLYKDFRISILLIFISVLGMSGSLWALYITGTPLNVGSYTGIIMIIGIIAENAIFTVQQFMWELNKTGSAEHAINYAISTRIRPKLMTAISAILALTPLALGIGIGAQMQQPLAIAVIGGFVMAMPMLLFVLPAFLKLIYRKHVYPKILI
jgi:multidrug efflux pump subunit AcrB